MGKLFLILIMGLLSLNCSENGVTNNDPGPVYRKIFSVERGLVRFDVYSSSAERYIYGYNELGIKVFLNNNEQNSGYVRFTPVIYKNAGGYRYNVPRSERFNFDSGNNMYSGYVIFLKDSLSYCKANFNYNDEMVIDSVDITIYSSEGNNILSWYNINHQKTFLLTLVKPVSPKVGLNPIELMLHSTTDSVSYEDVNNAEMFIKPWMESMGHGSSNNIHPTMISSARYRGVVNFNMTGEWQVYDSIKVNGEFITPSPPPYFIFQVR
ncbi:MAG: FixH family protein [Ignavibacteria bacterium]|nr:FixH family protein [Ignavibacteria bacterium]